jgi:hypothetical protein
LAGLQASSSVQHTLLSACVTLITAIATFIVRVLRGGENPPIGRPAIAERCVTEAHSYYLLLLAFTDTNQLRVERPPNRAASKRRATQTCDCSTLTFGTPARKEVGATETCTHAGECNTSVSATTISFTAFNLKAVLALIPRQSFH